MKVIAHRGANREALENSRDAYQRSVEGGAARIELDVQLSLDGHPVILHDDEPGHTCDPDDLAKLRCELGVTRLKISEMTAPQLKRIRLKNGEIIPFLDEIIDEFGKKIELNIEIKGRDPRLAEAVARICKTHGNLDPFVISSFELEPLIHLKEHHPQIQRACLWGTDNLSGTNFSRFAPPVFMAMAGARIFHPVVDWIDERLMDQAKTRGWQVYGWVPMAGEETSRESTWRFLAAIGVDGLCTNYPREMAFWLKGIRNEHQRIAELGTHIER